MSKNKWELIKYKIRLERQLRQNIRFNEPVWIEQVLSDEIAEVEQKLNVCHGNR